MKVLTRYDQKIIAGMLDALAAMFEDRGSYDLEATRARAWATYIREGKGK